jgi:hypothetical protein
MVELRTESRIAAEDLLPKIQPGARATRPNEEAKWYVWRIVSGPILAGRLMFFPPGEYRFGRPKVYMLWRLFPERVTLCNVGRSHRLFVNGQRVLDESPIYPGDEVRIGPFVLEAQGWQGKGPC